MSTDSPTVSIITAVYNGESSIVPTLHSVAAQDYPQIEHIVIDGGSGDATCALVRQHGHRVAKFISERDRGVYEAFNKGLRLASGKTIAFLNSGDTYTSSGVISRMVNTLVRARTQALFADVLIVEEREPARVLRRYNSQRFAPYQMAFGLMPAHPSLLVQREVYSRVGEFDESFRIAGDFELCIRIFVSAATTYCYLHEAVVRMPTGGLSNRGWKSKLTITREMRRACRMNNVRTNLAKLCLRFPLKVLEML